MCTMTKHLSLSAADLRHLCLQCKCGAKLTLDLGNYHGIKLKACPACGEDYDPRAEQDWNAMARIYENVSASSSIGARKYTISFLVPFSNSGGSLGSGGGE